MEREKDHISAYLSNHVYAKDGHLNKTKIDFQSPQHQRLTWLVVHQGGVKKTLILWSIEVECSGLGEINILSTGWYNWLEKAFETT